MSDRLLLSPGHRRVLEALLRQHLPGIEVWAYGSRVNGRGHEGSDLDLVLRGPGLKKIQLDRLMDFEEAVRESNIPFLVEARDWARLPERFWREIERGYVVVVAGLGGSDEWPKMSLCDAGISLYDCEHRTPPAQAAGYPYVGIPQIKHGRIDLTGARRITREDFDTWTRRAKPESFDIVLSRRCNPGETGFVSPGLDFALGQNLVLLRSDGTRVHKPFLRWLVRGPQWWEQVAKYVNVGAVFDSLRCADIPGFQLHVPLLPEQRAIAHILGALDDKIELNRRMNETLEAMARALFKSWFVDFDPVRAKMEGRDTGLPDHLADLFPDRLVDSEMGEIPEEWAVKPLKDCMLLTMGQSPPGSTYNEDGDGLPFFQGRTDFGFRYPTNRRFCSAPTRIASPEDTLVSVRAPVGDINVAWERCCIGRGVAALRHRSGSATYTYHSAWAMQRALREYQHTGTVFGAINKGQFEALRMIEADRKVVDAFDSLAGPLDARIRSSVSESRTLAALRDTLLPKLISGEIRTGDAESLVSTVSRDGP